MFWNKPGHVVLVVEDEPALLSVIMLILEDEGVEAVSAANAEDALRIFEARKDIGLLCTDIRMPGDMSGIQLANKVAELRPQTHIIVLSGALLPGDDDMPDKATFLQKPYDSDKLAATIKRVLS